MKELTAKLIPNRFQFAAATQVLFLNVDFAAILRGLLPFIYRSSDFVRTARATDPRLSSKDWYFARIARVQPVAHIQSLQTNSPSGEGELMFAETIVGYIDFVKNEFPLRNFEREAKVSLNLSLLLHSINCAPDRKKKKLQLRDLILPYSLRVKYAAMKL